MNYRLVFLCMTPTGFASAQKNFSYVQNKKLFDIFEVEVGKHNKNIIRVEVNTYYICGKAHKASNIRENKS